MDLALHKHDDLLSLITLALRADPTLQQRTFDSSNAALAAYVVQSLSSVHFGGCHEHWLGVVGSHWRVRLVEFDCICLRRSVVSKKEKKKGKEDESRSRPGKNASR